MKKIIVILGFLLTVSGAMADDSENTNVYIQQLVKEMDNAIENTDSVTLDLDAQNFIKSIENMSDDRKKVFTLFFFAERLFWRVYDDYVAILEQKSKETGRKLIKNDYDDGKRSVRLDNTGVSDDKCMFEDFCDYPDGYEECSMDLHVHSDEVETSYTLGIVCDDKQSNKVNSIMLMMDMQQRNGSGSFGIDIFGSESKFDEMVKYRQEETEVRRFNVAQLQKSKKSRNFKDSIPSPESANYGIGYLLMYDSSVQQ